ncbi:hypothetical protein KOY48_02690 [Candidatus Minimicrobia naudis]|uniref:Tetratricopeptide repeat protein n=1 Tax=Candidatus Minimicrobia naudis TaxID=2841263 RepID=A0A8F1SBM3_9BACT|nr:hypothetical protein KOY48_02690 [Candidatus Minimicrobia naudis]
MEPSASSLHNVGLIYYETENYEKASLAFEEQALEMEDDLAARYIAYAKVQEKIGNTKKVINALEKAVELEPIPQTLKILAEAYDNAGQAELAEELRKKATKMLTPTASSQKTADAPRPRQQRKIHQPRKIVM